MRGGGVCCRRPRGALEGNERVGRGVWCILTGTYGAVVLVSVPLDYETSTRVLRSRVDIGSWGRLWRLLGEIR